MRITWANYSYFNKNCTEAELIITIATEARIDWANYTYLNYNTHSLSQSQLFQLKHT